MATNKKSYDELSVSEKIEAKKKKIKRLFREMPPEKRQFAEGLINQFAVTSVTLERLADEINNGDLIEDFVQGAQKLRRESPALRAYNTTILWSGESRGIFGASISPSASYNGACAITASCRCSPGHSFTTTERACEAKGTISPYPG